MKTKNRDFYAQMSEAEGLLERAKELRESMERNGYDDTHQSREAFLLTTREIDCLSSEAGARLQLAHLYYITG